MRGVRGPLPVSAAEPARPPMAPAAEGALPSATEPAARWHKQVTRTPLPDQALGDLYRQVLVTCTISQRRRGPSGVSGFPSGWAYQPRRSGLREQPPATSAGPAVARTC